MNKIKLLMVVSGILFFLFSAVHSYLFYFLDVCCNRCEVKNPCPLLVDVLSFLGILFGLVFLVSMNRNTKVMSSLNLGKRLTNVFK